MWEGRQVLQSSSILKAVKLHVLDIPSTLHPSREELVQLPGFAGLDVPLLQGVLGEEQGEEELLVHLRSITADCKRLLDFSQTSGSF